MHKDPNRADTAAGASAAFLPELPKRFEGQRGEFGRAEIADAKYAPAGEIIGHFSRRPSDMLRIYRRTKSRAVIGIIELVYDLTLGARNTPEYAIITTNELRYFLGESESGIFRAVEEAQKKGWLEKEHIAGEGTAYKVFPRRISASSVVPEKHFVTKIQKGEIHHTPRIAAFRQGTVLHSVEPMPTWLAPIAGMLNSTPVGDQQATLTLVTAPANSTPVESMPASSARATALTSSTPVESSRPATAAEYAPRCIANQACPYIAKPSSPLPGPASLQELSQLKEYLTDKFARRFRRDPDGPLLNKLLDTLHGRCATVENFIARLEERDSHGNPIHSFGLLTTIAAECPTLEPAPAAERHTPEALQHLERRRAARRRGQGK